MPQLASLPKFVWQMSLFGRCEAAEASEKERIDEMQQLQLSYRAVLMDDADGRACSYNEEMARAWVLVCLPPPSMWYSASTSHGRLICLCRDLRKRC